MINIKNEVRRELAGASLRGERSPDTSRVLWQLNSYIRFSRGLGVEINRVGSSPAQMPMQPACLAMIAELAISAFI